jgi:molecular chaperone DnaK
MVMQRLKEAAEKAKIELSTVLETEINLPFLTADAAGPKHLTVKLSRSQFEKLANPIIERSKAPCLRCLEDAGMKPSDIHEILLVGGSIRIPRVQQLVKELFGKEGSKSVNPDEVVAAGAAVQGAVLSGEVKDVLLLDVTPLSLGIETLGGVMTKLIERNSTIPIRKSETFSTASDNQTSVEIHVLQGEREMANNNRSLGRFQLVGIPSAPRGMPQIEVTFDLDANGIVNVTAKDKATAKEQKITITHSSGLSKEDIDKMMRDAEANMADDKKRHEEIQSRNHLDSLVYQTEKLVSENKEKLPAEQVKSIEEALGSAKKALEMNQHDAIKRELDNLTKASHKLAEVMYKTTGGAQQQGAPSTAEPEPKGPPNGSGKKPDDVIDAEYKDVN